jgi:hypothetical protein
VPKLKSQVVSASDQQGGVMNIRCEISVTEGGTFRAKLPKAQAEDPFFISCLDRAIAKADSDPSNQAKAKREQLRTNTYLLCLTRRPIDEILVDAMTCYLAEAPRNTG